MPGVGYRRPVHGTRVPPISLPLPTPDDIDGGWLDHRYRRVSPWIPISVTGRAGLESDIDAGLPQLWARVRITECRFRP